jgi:hypothetical protein
MSRSRRHTPVCGITTARSEKADKRQAHRRLRARARSVAARAHPERDAVWPGLRDVSDPWSMAKDGKRAFDPARWPRLLRK